MSFGIKQAERDFGVDIDGDGVIGGAGRAFPQGGAHGNAINQMERMTGMDINGDGRVGGGPGFATQPPRLGGGVTSYQTYSSYSVSGTGNIPGGSATNQLERMTGMDLNGDGRIGGTRR